MNTIIRAAGGYPSTTTVGHGLSFKPIYEAFDETTTKALIVHIHPPASRAGALAQCLRKQGIEASTADYPDTEAGKSIEVAVSLWDECGHLQLGRKDAIVAMGGGATIDITGFVAATWLRGITLINVPATLLAMVDTAVGGRAGINTSVRKNPVGSFYLATSMVADMGLLENLPTPDLTTGAAEVIKYGFIADPGILRIVEETEPNESLRSYSLQLAEITIHMIAVKARIVSADLTEGSLREILNYGHILTHTIERVSDYTWRHGNVVAIDCCFAAHLAQARGLLSADDVSRHNQLFSRVRLPTRYEGNALDELTHIMLSDKKVRRGILCFVLLDGIASPETVSVDPQGLRASAFQIDTRA